MTLVLRVVFLFMLLVVAAVLAAWLAESPGSVTLDWRGYRIDTSVPVLIVAALVLFLVGAGLYQIWRLLRRTPRRVRERRALRRREQGYMALTRGMVAIAAGDTVEAKEQARRASHILGRPPGALLLGAQAAQIEGRPEVARKFYDAMLETREGELIGLRGLITLAEQEGKPAEAIALAEKARKIAPRQPWVLTRLFHLQIAARRWEDAEATLSSARKSRAIADDVGKRDDAVVLIQLSLMAERKGNRRQALDHARKAHRMAPDLLPATLQYGALLLADGRRRQARRVVEEGWRTAPHPDLARLYRTIVDGDDAVARLRAMERLAEIAPRARETHLALARAALDAKLWGEARRHLKEGGKIGADRSDGEKPAGGEPDAAFCRLYAELEQAEHGDAGAARDWLSRVATAPPEPAWICRNCGAVAREWAALCGHCGTFDGLRWTTPHRVQALGPDGEARASDSLAMAEESDEAKLILDPSASPRSPTSPATAPAGNAAGTGGTLRALGAAPPGRSRDGPVGSDIPVDKTGAAAPEGSEKG